MTMHYLANVPKLEKRLTQLNVLTERYSPDAIHWRFDPLCFYSRPDGSHGDNLEAFSRIAEHVAGTGVNRCITSFMDDYAKIRKRVAALKGFSFTDPPVAKKMEILLSMQSCLSDYGIRLFTCCEKEVMDHMHVGSAISQGSCIPNDRLAGLYGPGVSLRRDSGQRRTLGCGCRVSVDIGSYNLHPCYHNCLFCYANPSPPESGNQ